MGRLSSVYKNKELRNKIIVLLVCLGIYKLGMYVYVPFIDRNILDQMFQAEGSMFLMNTFTGGALSNFSIFAVGIMPYITASIIIQLLQMDVVPILTAWKNEGAMGQKKIKNLTYVVTIFFALLQSIGISFGFGKMYKGLIKNESVTTYILIAIVLTIGTAILVVLGEIIEKKGIGRGISIIILAGILMTVPNMLVQYYEMVVMGEEEKFISVISAFIVGLFFLILTLVVIFVDGSLRRIPMQSVTGGTYGKVSRANSYLPIKINVAGVIPVIFASALFMLPQTVAQFTGGKVERFINEYLGYTSVTGIIMYAILIILFTYFYAFIQMDPKKVSDNLKQGNMYIPTIRPGRETEEYLKGVLVRLTTVGAIFLAAVSIIPMIVGNFVTMPDGMVYAGTSIIIVVSVIIDFSNQLKVETTGSNYTRFIKNKNLKKKGKIWG